MNWPTTTILLLSLCGACNEAPAETVAVAETADERAQKLPTTQVRLGNLRFDLQIAKTPDQRETGLMFVTGMPKKSGMIFVFPRAGEMSFWMENTLIPLDILFLDPAGKVIKIAQMQPRSQDLTHSDGLCQWVIELNAGMAAEAGVKVGDVIAIPLDAAVDVAE